MASRPPGNTTCRKSCGNPLDEKPASLNETYALLLGRIPESSPDRRLLRRCPLCLSFVARPLRLFELTKAMIMDNEMDSVDNGDSFTHQTLFWKSIRGSLVWTLGLGRGLSRTHLSNSSLSRSGYATALLHTLLTRTKSPHDEASMLFPIPGAIDGATQVKEESARYEDEINTSMIAETIKTSQDAPE